MNALLRPDILTVFQDQKAYLEIFLSKLEVDLKSALESAGLKIHSITGRLKELSALKRKISRPERTYSDLWDVTDLVAFRVITYFEDTIEHVAKCMEESFVVDFENSSNKLRYLEPERFGYRSLHYVCFLKDSQKLEFAALKSLRFEVQIRSLLQHAWAEMEHDAGYKAKVEISPDFRRRFSQLAGLLELADREFVTLRNQLAQYEEALRERCVGQDDRVPINCVSLRTLLEREEVSALDREVSEILGKELSSEVFYPDYLLRVLQAAGLDDFQLVLGALSSVRSELRGFLAPYFEFSEKIWNFGVQSIEYVSKGYGLLFVAHLSVYQSQNLLLDRAKRMELFYREIDYKEDPERAAHVARQFIEHFSRQRPLNIS